ncbi:Hypothetical protein FNO222_1825 [Francisella orientalis]|uniref:Uncharacterized protein n=1 Tax=Francisella orientalis TaxID=299583 RepID=A0ABM5U8P2_9GAMM|nr:hypothetical protein FNO12_1810 [Francisella orientalis FNO12]AKN87837.1 Hypothetical protein FNO24_1812 [Francisella orientalis FNO24]AKN89376.1 Hypothetical protein FNO190_1810 [Francisella orientalis]AKU06135.1 Hypothetical protein FNO01_1810 [Francisella orientalis]QEN21052.1 Hypothetical protein FNO39_1825 [Francisella orientalis]
MLTIWLHLRELKYIYVESNKSLYIVASCFQPYVFVSDV